LERQGKHPASSPPFWKKINYHKPKQNTSKSLFYNKRLYHSDFEKANLFTEILQATFSEENNEKFDSKFKKSVADTRKNANKNANDQVINLISMQDLDEAIKNLNNKSSHGLDGISNLLIKHFPLHFKKIMAK
jgi:hypothetical protein